jgi:hypothetical protein
MAKSRQEPRGRTLYKFDEDVARRIVLSITAGNYTETAAAAAGISKVTLLDWLKRGARPGAPPALAAFARDYAQAEAKAEELHLGSITKASIRGQWPASAWFLERKHPTRWGRKDQVALTGRDGKPLPPPARVVLMLPDDGSAPPAPDPGKKDPADEA